MHPCYLQKMKHEAQVRLYLDGCDGEGDLPPTIDVRVQNTKNVLELLRDDQRLKTHNTHVIREAWVSQHCHVRAFSRAVHANTLQTYNTIVIIIIISSVCI